MGNGSSREKDKNATGFGTDSNGLYTHSEAAEILQGHDLTSRLELTFSAFKLKNTDMLGGKIDPFLVLAERTSTGSYKELFRSEIVANQLNPKWVNAAYVAYNFDSIQNIQIEIYDVKGGFKSSDASNLKLGAQKLIGKVATTVAELVSTQKWQKPVVNKRGKVVGSVQICTEELANTNSYLKMGLSADKIPKQSFASRNSCFLRLSKLREDGTWAQCYKTEVATNQSSPNFKPIEGPVLQLTNGDLFRPLKIELFTYKPNGVHPKLGEVETSLDQLKTVHETKGTLDFQNPEARRQLKKEGAYGYIRLWEFKLEERPTFLNFIRGGMDLNFLVAVDFTMSNKLPTDRNSLHYLDPRGQILNPYARAILGVGQVLEYYDTSKTFPCYGFGGKDRNGVANHCFALNGNPQNPYVSGIDGILAAYYQALEAFQLSGPTIISQVINQAAAMANQRPISQSSQHYTVLLIMTDGVINDKDQTVEAIVRASALPMSVLILGIGDEDFTEMERLDGDSAVLKTRSGQKTKRDIVQFVSMRALEKKYGNSLNHSAMVAQALLEELPQQVLEYYKVVRIVPNSAAPPPPYVEPDANAVLEVPPDLPSDLPPAYTAPPMPSLPPPAR